MSEEWSVVYRMSMVRVFIDDEGDEDLHDWMIVQAHTYDDLLDEILYYMCEQIITSTPYDLKRGYYERTVWRPCSDIEKIMVLGGNDGIVGPCPYYRSMNDFPALFKSEGSGKINSAIESYIDRAREMMESDLKRRQVANDVKYQEYLKLKEIYGEQ